MDHILEHEGQPVPDPESASTVQRTDGGGADEDARGNFREGFKVLYLFQGAHVGTTRERYLG